MKALVTTNTTSKTERVFLIGAQFSSRTAYEVQESLSELAELAKTAGGTDMLSSLKEALALIEKESYADTRFLAEKGKLLLKKAVNGNVPPDICCKD